MRDLDKQTKLTEKLQPVSLTDESSMTLTCSLNITSGPEQDDVDAFLTKRIGVLMRIGFQQDLTPEAHAEIVNEYRRALRHHPKWVLAKAIDIAVRSAAGRPTPGNINAAAHSVTKPIADELARRNRSAASNPAHRPFAAKTDAEREAGERALQAAGFTAKRFDAVKRKRMATSEAELYRQTTERPPHWSDGLPDDDPRMIALRKARAENKLIGGAA